MLRGVDLKQEIRMHLSEDRKRLEITCSKMSLLRSVAMSVEKLMNRRMPGLTYTSRIVVTARPLLPDCLCQPALLLIRLLLVPLEQIREVTWWQVSRWGVRD